jgi:hypothetical protein
MSELNSAPLSRESVKVLLRRIPAPSARPVVGWHAHVFVGTLMRIANRQTSRYHGPVPLRRVLVVQRFLSAARSAELGRSTPDVKSSA